MSIHKKTNPVCWSVVASLLVLATVVPLSMGAAPGGGPGAGAAGGAGARGGRGGGRGAVPRPEYIPEGYDDHQNMMDQLGVKALRGLPDSRYPDYFFEEDSNPYPNTMPDALTMKDGTKVTTAAQWAKRRAEIYEDMEREVYGRIPKNVPKVTWEVTATTPGMSGTIPVVTKTLVGHVDNSGFPAITVNISASYTVPANASGPVPIIVEFGAGGGGGARRGGAPGGGAGGGRRGAPAPGGDQAAPPARGGAMGPVWADEFFVAAPVGPAVAAAPAQRPPPVQLPGRPAPTPGAFSPDPAVRAAYPIPWTQQAIAKGWGYGNINPGSIQGDGGGFALRSGIIGLVNKGEPRKPDDWGALRAWQWGVSRMIDYFEQNPDSKVDPKKVGVEGLSRYGKASVVTAAFEERVAVALVGSCGQGGAKLNRHVFGESVENLAGGEYYWMAGNFIKYGASDPKMTAGDLPVDGHELIAMVAPRPCFLSYGIVEQGDSKWNDAHGVFMAGVLAGPVYRLLGKKDLGTPGNYLTDAMPPVKTLIGGNLAWRQHEGGHDVTPNWPTFWEWVGNYVKAPPLPQGPGN